jgi:threonine dehydratase
MGGVPEENFVRAKSSLLGVERVAEDDIRAAMRALFLSHGMIVEAAGAVAYALARSGRLPGRGPVALVLSGGNLSPERRAEISV